MALGVVSAASGTFSIAAGRNSIASGEQSSAFGYQSNATGLDSTAYGYGTVASGANATAIGNKVTAAAAGSIAIGADTGIAVDATSTNGIALGTSAKVTNAVSGIAIGNSAASTAVNSISVGNNAASSAANSIALGTSTVANSAEAVAIGNGSKAGGGRAVATGSGITATGEGAFGSGLANTATGAGSVALGNTNLVGGGGQAVGIAGTPAQGAVGIGFQNTAIGQGSVAIGSTSRALAAGAVAFGNNAVANNAGDVALGSGATTAVAVGTVSATINGTLYNFAGTAPASTVSVGAVGAPRTITNMAAGRISAVSTDAINGSQLFATNQAVGVLGQGWTVLAQDVNPTKVGVASGTGNTVNFRNADGNLVISKGAANNILAFNLSNDVVVGNSLTIGASLLNSNGLTITGGPSITAAGVNAGNLVITNVAPGVAGTNAVNVNQLTSAVGSATVAGLNVTGNDATAGIVHRDLGQTLAIQGTATTAGTYSGGNLKTVTDPTTGAINLQMADAPVFGTVTINAGGSGKITGVAAGTVAAASTDAVNGSQLFGISQSVANNLGGGSVVNPDGTVTGPTYNVAGSNYSTVFGAVSALDGNLTHYYSINDGGTPLANYNNDGATGAASTAIGIGALASIDGSIALGTGSVADRAIAPISGTMPAGFGFVPYNTTDATLLGAVSVGNATTGEYRQITNVADGTRARDAVTLRQLQGAISSVTVTPTRYFHANSLAADSLSVGAESIAVGPTTVVNGDNGIGIGNGAIVDISAPGGTAIGQNATVSQADAIALGTNSVADGIQSIAIGPGANASFSGSVALGAGATTSVGSQTGYTGYGLAAPQNSAGEVSVGSAGAERKLTNVAAGSAPTDAVNVSQLNQVSQNTATSLGGGAAYDPATGAYTAPSYAVGGSNYNNVGDALGAQNDLTDSLGTTVASGLGGSSTYDPTTGAVTTSLDVSGNNYTNVNDALQAINQTASAGWNIQANGGAPTNIPSNGTLNVTAGSNTVVTLSGNQLQVAVADNPTFAGMVTANGGLTVGQNQSVNMGGNVVENVGAGAVTAASTNAVNGSQLYQVQQVASNSVQYDASGNSVTFNPGGQAARLQNVAAGVAPTDAVNVQQMNTGLANTLTAANAYTDARLVGVAFDLAETRRDSFAGTAGALAAAGLPQAFEPGRGMLAFGAGTYAGQSAFALGLSRVMDDGRTIIKAGATYDTQQRAGANVGVGFQF